MDTSALEWLKWEGLPDQAQRGCSLGNAHCFLRADAEANIDGIWLPVTNRWYTGELSLRVVQPASLSLQRVTYAPAYQSAWYGDDATGAQIEKRLFVAAEGAIAYLRIRGEGFDAAENAPGVEMECRWRIAAARSEMHRQQPPGQDCERQWEFAAEQAHDSLPYLLCPRPKDSGPDGGVLWAKCPPLSSQWTEPSLVKLAFHVPITAEGTFDFWVSLSVGWDGLNRIPRHQFSEAAASIAFADAEQAVAEIVGPEPREPTLTPLVAKAVGWGKVGSRRVWHRYASGDEGFTNDPPGNTIVTRDAAWFIYGADHFAPHWSRALLETLVRHAAYSYPQGKIAEYVRIAPQGITRDDYNLNINDATPLFVLAASHHWRTTDDRQALERCYPTVRDAADWILAQRKEDDGLVWCDGRGTNVFGIGGWRNIIPGYRLAGALTELNAECVAALRGAAEMAEACGEKEDRRRFAEEAEQLDAAMAQLVDPQTGYLLLTRDENGPNPQLAVDLVLPALLHAGPEEARVRTLLRLVEDDFRGPHGLRTLSKNDPAYHPRFGFGLMGGSWPNATAWAAAALAPYRPDLAWELAEEVARALFPETRTLPGVGVPGEFPEWFDGDTGESLGMSLSPWMPATYVWLITEGLRGSVPAAPPLEQ